MTELEKTLLMVNATPGQFSKLDCKRNGCVNYRPVIVLCSMIRKLK